MKFLNVLQLNCNAPYGDTTEIAALMSHIHLTVQETNLNSKNYTPLVILTTRLIKKHRQREGKDLLTAVNKPLRGLETVNKEIKAKNQNRYIDLISLPLTSLLTTKAILSTRQNKRTVFLIEDTNPHFPYGAQTYQRPNVGLA